MICSSKYFLGDYNIIEPPECVDIIATTCSLNNIGTGKKTFLYKLQSIYNYSYKHYMLYNI